MKHQFNFKAEAVLQVYKTTNYSAFKFLKGNRRPHQLHIKRLTESFQDNYLISPIIVNEKMQIIDGQHRFISAQKLALPIYFIVLEGYSLPEVQILNSNGKQFSKEDALEGYCDLGVKDYIEMRDFMKNYPEFGVGVSIQLLTNRVDGSDQKIYSGGKRNTFKAGGFKVGDLKLAYQNAAKLLDISKFYAGYNRKTFVGAMLSIFKHKNYNHDEFMHKLSKNKEMLTDTTTSRNYRLMIEDIFNYKRRDKVSLTY